MLVLETPLDAYRSDLARNKHRSDFGGSDTIWLLSSHCLSRLSRSGRDDRRTIASQCAGALRDFLDPEQGDSGSIRTEGQDLQLIIEGLEALDDRAGADALARGIRGMSSRMAEAGALSSAYSSLAYAREVANSASDREQGLLAADQAYVARALGDLDAAETLYQQAATVGERACDFSLLARVCIGRGVVNRVRGNYPRARIFFERALELAESAKAQDLVLLAHQGLTICLAIAKDFDLALQHAWSTYELSRSEGGMKEVEALGNLAQLCLDAGYPRAALQGFAAVLDRTDTLRICLSMLGGAAVAASRCAERSVLNRVASEAERRIMHSALPYENAQALYHLAMAFATVGETSRSEEYQSRTRRLAKARGFFELLHALESGELTRTSASEIETRELSVPSRSVVESVERLDVGTTADVLALAG